MYLPLPPPPPTRVLSYPACSQPASPRTPRHEHLAAIPEVQRALQRWRDMDGVLLEPSDQNELASAVMLARCCADPPPVSTLGWGGSGGDSASGAEDRSVAAAAASAGVVACSSGDGIEDAVGIEQGGVRGGVAVDVGHAAVGPSNAKGVVAAAASPFPGFSVGGEGVEDGVGVGRVGASMSGVTSGPGWLKRPVPRLDGERESRFRKVDGAAVDEGIDVGGGAGGPSRQHMPV